MDLGEQRHQLRTGATPKNSGLQTIAFFALISVVVSAAGFFAMVVWDPEKPIKNRSHLATDPPPAISLPSLPADTPVEAPPVVESVPPAASSAAVASPAPKRAKKGPQKASATKH